MLSKHLWFALQSVTYCGIKDATLQDWMLYFMSSLPDPKAILLVGGQSIVDWNHLGSMREVVITNMPMDDMAWLIVAGDAGIDGVTNWMEDVADNMSSCMLQMYAVFLQLV